MKIQGTIRRITTKMDASGNKVQTIVLEVHGDITALNALIESPLVITVEAE